MKKSATDRQWEGWGKKNPYFGVLGVESSAISREDIEAAFLASGEAHISDTLKESTRLFGESGEKRSALDFGCGVGRLLLPLSRRFDQVTRVDISPAMIDLARKRVADDPRINFAQHLSDLEPGRRYDFVHSYIVLQHIRPDQGYPLISELIDCVDEGGVFAIHVTIGDLSRARRILNYFRYRLPPLHWAYNIVRKRPWDEPITEMNCYNMARLLQLLRGRYDRIVGIRDFDQNGHVGVMLFGRR